MTSYIFTTILTALTLTSLTYGDVDSNRSALNAVYSYETDGIDTYDLVQEPEFSIFIQKLNGELIKINLSWDTYIYEIKDLIEEFWGVPFDKQRFIFSGKALEDHKTIDYYLHSVRDYDGTIIYLVVRR